MALTKKQQRARKREFKLRLFLAKIELTEFLGEVVNFLDGLGDLRRLGEDDLDLADPVAPIRVVDDNAHVVLKSSRYSASNFGQWVADLRRTLSRLAKIWSNFGA